MVKIKNVCYRWGGNRAKEKLDAFIKYVQAYLSIMNVRKKKYGWGTIYFDGFAGSGEGSQCTTDDKEDNSIFQLSIDSCCEEHRVYQGAAERVLALGKDGFDYVYFIEKNDESVQKLRSKLEYYNTDNVQSRQGDANEQLKKLAQAHINSSEYASLVFLDPFGMGIKWESIKALKGTRADVWILVPTGVIINRLPDRQGQLKSIRKLETFFGLSGQEIEGYFYKAKQMVSLFGELAVREEIPNATPKVAELYIKRLKTTWKYVTEESPVLYNSNNVPIFHLVFASNNSTAKRIVSQIIK